MNERIKQLAEQAGMTKILNEHAREYGSGMFENTPYPELEKFAELIVRECINICKDIADPHLYRNQDMHQRMAPGASYAAKLIETRFSELKNEQV